MTDFKSLKKYLKNLQGFSGVNRIISEEQRISYTNNFFECGKVVVKRRKWVTMKKLMVIGTVGFCSLLIGITVIAKEQTMGPKEVTVRETENVKMNERAAVNISSLDNLILPEILEEKRVEAAESESLTGADMQQETSSNDAAANAEVKGNPAVAQESVSSDNDTQDAEVKESPVIAQEKGSYNNNISGIDTVVSPAAPQEEAPVMQQQETAIGNMADAESCVQQAPCNTEGCTFIDANHDGLCDYGDVHHHNGAHMDANHDGYCDYGDQYCMNTSGSQGSGFHHSNGHHGGRHH